MTAASPMASLSRTSREVQLLAVPDGLSRPAHFRVVRTPLPQPVEGEMLVRNRYFLVFPGLRTVVGGGLEGAPSPARSPGTRSAGRSSPRWWPLRARRVRGWASRCRTGAADGSTPWCRWARAPRSAIRRPIRWPLVRDLRRELALPTEEEQLRRRERGIGGRRRHVGDRDAARTCRMRCRRPTL